MKFGRNLVSDDEDVLMALDALRKRQRPGEKTLYLSLNSFKSFGEKLHHVTLHFSIVAMQ